MARKCVNCESRKGMTRFKDEIFTIGHGDERVTVGGLAGWRC